MKKFNPLLTIAAPLILLFAVSCSKKSDPAPSRTALLSAKNWMITKEEQQENSGTKTEVTIDDCNMDDYYTFAAGGVYTYHPGNNVCDSDDTTDTGSWAFKTNDTILEIADGTATLDFTITTLTSTSMTFNYSIQYDSNNDGTLDSTVTLFYTWKTV